MSTQAIKTTTDIPPQITTPDILDTRLGQLDFEDGAPTDNAALLIYDNLDFTHALNVYLNTFQVASQYALRQGLLSIGAEDDTVVLFPEPMDSRSLFLTGHCDTVHALSMIDLSRGPMVVEVPPMALGAVNDMWLRWVIDLGTSGPDRGEGGKYLLLPPGYTGELPDGGFHLARADTTRVAAFVHFFLENDDPKPVVERIKKHFEVYPYVPGGYGTSVATILSGKARSPETLAPAPPTAFVEASGKAFNTVPASDYRFFEQLDALVQEQPATLDPELAGQLSAIGIVKGKPFQPDARMKKILTDAAAVGNATARVLSFRFRDDRWSYYEGSSWMNFLFEGGHTFEAPAPMVTKEGVQSLAPAGARTVQPLAPAGGARTVDARTAMFFACAGVSPGMCMSSTGLGSPCLFSFFDAKRRYFDGEKTYTLTLPRGIPAQLWSLTLYDNQTRSMLQTEQRFPRAGSQSYPTPAAVADAAGATTVFFSPKKPEGVEEGNWIQTVPAKGWFIVLRLYGPLPPFFDKSWRPSEIEEVRSQPRLKRVRS